MRLLRTFRLWGVLALLLPAVACAQGERAVGVTPAAATAVSAATETPRPMETGTAVPPTATVIPTATATPLPTPTATPPAPPAIVIGDVRASLLQAPVPQGNAPCGVVDLFDFPMDPPHGDNVSGGQDFGRFRDRFDKYHAGEDWWTGSGSSFGAPVYSIGHGLVTYAEPEGWNRDKGVIIIQHRLANGRSLLSFYGHLDPPSVTLTAGECVTRGQQIGEIGRPRSSPHLHFEMRTQAPYATLTGYWPEDPTLVGWLPPSQTIWEQRISAVATVAWLREPLPGNPQPVGLLDPETLLLTAAGGLLALNTADGQTRWRFVDEAAAITAAALDETEPIVYVAQQNGRLAAWALPDDAAAAPAPLWQTAPATLVGSPTLLPLPGGGLLAAARRDWTALSPQGDVRWTQTNLGQPLAWAAQADGWWIATAGGDAPLIWLDAEGVQPWSAPAGSVPVISEDTVWLYARDGLYRLDREAETAVLHFPLPEGSASLGDVIALPDGGLLLAHVDRADRRLLAFAPDGALRWERSYAGQLDGALRLAAAAAEHVWVTVAESGSGRVDVYALNMETAVLRQLLPAGTRTPRAGLTWLLPLPEQLLLQIGGGHLLALRVP